MRSRASVCSALIALLLLAAVTQLQGIWLSSSSPVSSENSGITQVPPGQRGPRIDTLRRKVTASQDAQMMEMTAGPPTGSDVWQGLVNQADLEEMYEQEKTVSSRSGYHMCFIGFNYRVHPLDDVNFRHALTLLYPRSSIVGTVFKYVSVEIKSPVPPAQSLWYNFGVDPHSYNPEKAEEILTAAGYQFVGGEWKDTDGSDLPTLRFFCPLEAIAPTSYTASRRLVEEAQAIGLNNIVITPTDFVTYTNLVFNDRDFEIFWICYSLGKFPTHLYDMFHSINDVPGGHNCYGVNYPELDVLLNTFSTSLDNTAKVTAAREAQELIMGGSTANLMPNYVAPTDPRTQAIPIIPVYSRNYYDVQQPDLEGAVNMFGYGAENTWTHMNIYWDTPNEYRPGTTEKKVVYVEYGFPERLNPLYATWSYSWDYMEDSFDSLIATSPLTHYGEPWLATSWECEAVPGGLDVTFNLRLTDSQGQPIKWQDGTAISVSNVKFAWDFLRSWQIPKYWSTFRYYDPTNTVIVDADTIRARMTTNNPWLIYDLADTAYMLPPQIWQNNPLTGQSWANQAEILGFDPSAHGGPNGLPTMLFGTGPFVLQHSTSFINTNGFGDLTANRYYWMTTQEVIDKISYMFWRAGDVDRNGWIDWLDVDAISQAYLTEPGDPLWNPDADITGEAGGPPDNKVDAYDRGTAQKFNGESKEVLTDKEKQRSVLTMVNNHRGALPPELVLAVIRIEGGVGAFHINGWDHNPSIYRRIDGSWAQPTKGDGIMQVVDGKGGSGYHEKSGLYTNDRDGYDHAIKDGCDYLLELYNTRAYGTYVQAVLHYNSGPASLYTYLATTGGSEVYLSKAAEYLTTFVKDTYEIENPSLVCILNKGQSILDSYLYNKGIKTWQTPEYYRTHQRRLDSDLQNLELMVNAREAGMRVSTFACPINVTISDEYGRTISEVENQIPTANFAYFNATDTKIFYLPLNLTYHVQLNATDYGNCTIDQIAPTEYVYETVFSQATFDLTNETLAEFSLLPYDANYTVNVDEDGNGQTDYELTPETETLTTEYDIGLARMTPSRTIIGESYSLHVNITVENYGAYTETFDITLYSNSTIIETQTVTLANRTSTTTTFTWNTAGFAKGNYRLTANATEILGETFTLDNTKSFSAITVTILGDVNGNRIVNVFDLYTLGKAYGSSPGQLNWNSCCDINGDEFIDNYDLAPVSDNYGRSY
jgi:ABC-type oligopeptide transport system substrate-binding subunit